MDLTWAILDPIWAPLDPSWAPLGVSWASLGVLRAPLGGLWWVQGRLLELSHLWEVTWGYLEGAVSRCMCAWCCPWPFWSPWTPSLKSNLRNFHVILGIMRVRCPILEPILSSFVMHFVSVCKWTRLGRPGQSQGDLISGQLDKKDPLTVFGPGRAWVMRDHLGPLTVHLDRLTGHWQVTRTI